MDISIVVPIYNEAANIRPLYQVLKAVLEETGRKYEIIYVDDGSNDDSLKILKDLKKTDAFVKGIVFRKNFGQTAALDAGIKAALGGMIVTMDGDLQNDPADIPLLIKEMEKGYDVVSGWRYKRNDSSVRNFLSRIANLLRKFLLGDMIHDSGCTLKAYKKECFNNLNLYGEMHRFIPAILAWKGFSIGEVKVRHHSRKAGKTKYNLTRVVKGFLDLLVLRFWMQYSSRPMHLFGILGFIFLALGLGFGTYLTIIKFYFKAVLTGRPLLFLTVLLFVVGVQFIIFGILADIMVQIYYGQREKQFYNIKEILN